MSKLQIIDAGWLIDGSAKPIRPKVQLRIIDGRIETIRENQPIRSGQTPDNSDAQTLDLNDATILPALVDSHVHLTMSGTMDQDERVRQLDMGFDLAEDVIRKHLDQHL
ncbi:MAG: hypothetical protein JRD84_05790, partial [Deltaproteobacteria bacterium]|nr:hypothetical protein [Deltaproteobacteria bacterium]